MQYRNRWVSCFDMKHLLYPTLIALLAVAWSRDVQAAPEEGSVQSWPWQLYMSSADALKVPGFGHFRQTKENLYESEPSTFLGKKAVTTLLFGERGLDSVRVVLYQGEDKAEALDAWCKLFAWQKARNGEVQTFNSGIPRKGDAAEVRKKTEEWLASKPPGEVVKLFTNSL